MASATWIAFFILLTALLWHSLFQMSEEPFTDYIAYVPRRRGGPWYGGRAYYQPWWGYRYRWWDALYEPPPWGPCPGPWCPYR